MNRFAKRMVVLIMAVLLLCKSTMAWQNTRDPAAVRKKVGEFSQRFQAIKDGIKDANLDQLFDLLDQLSTLRADIAAYNAVVGATASVVFPTDKRASDYASRLATETELRALSQTMHDLTLALQALQYELMQRRADLKAGRVVPGGGPGANAPQPAGSEASKVKIVNSSGKAVAGLKISIRHDDGDRVVSTDEKGEAPIPTPSFKYHRIVVSGPGQPDIRLSQSDVRALGSRGTRFVVVHTDHVLNDEEFKKTVGAVVKAAEEQTGEKNLVGRVTNLPGLEGYEKDGKTIYPHVIAVYPKGSLDSIDPHHNRIEVDGEGMVQTLQQQPDLPEFEDVTFGPIVGDSETEDTITFRLNPPVVKIGVIPEKSDMTEEEGQRFDEFSRKVVEDALRETIGPVQTESDQVLELGENGQTKVFVFKSHFDPGTFYNPDGTLKIFLPDANQNIVQVVQQQPAVAKAELQIKVTADAELPNDPHFSSRGSWGQQHDDQWALHRVGFSPIKPDGSSAWPKRWLAEDRRLTPVVVAVIGGGVDHRHPELQGRIWINFKETPFDGVDDDNNGYVDDIYGWNFKEGSGDVMDYGGHDTHIAGVIGARWNNGIGMAGVNPAALIMPLKVANYLGEGDTISVAQAIRYAVDHGARVINISYTGDQHSHIFQLAVDYAVSQGVLVVAAAGNQDQDADERGVAGARGVFTVAGTTVEGKRVGFSNWGQPVDIASPAMDVLGLRASGTDFLHFFDENPDYKPGTAIVGKDRDLYRAGGTSFGTPLVAGTASLLWSLEPELTLEQVKNKLLMGAEDIETPGWDQFTGAGLLNAKKAIEADPDHFLHTRIARLEAVTQDGKTAVRVHGRAVGTAFSGRWLQIGFGETPGRDEWVTVKYDKQPVANGLLGTIPISKFDRAGVWTVRVLVQDQQKTVRQSRARLDLN